MNSPSSAEMRRIMPRARSAYYIVAPPYIRTSAGVRVLHLLCHALNRIGERAYMIIRPFPARGPATHPDLLTPLLDNWVVKADEDRRLTPITVYPETESGNPLRAPFVVRYVMNFPGLLLGGEKRYGPEDLCYGFSAMLAEAAGAPDNVLFLPPADIDVFGPEPRVPRQGTCFFAGKYKYFHRGELFPVTADSIEIKPGGPGAQTPAEIADLLRRSEVLYLYENTALAVEAVLCECPVVFLPNPYLSGIIAVRDLGNEGYAWGSEPQEVARAKTTVAQARLNYLASYDRFWSQLDKFVAVTQERAARTPYAQPMYFRRLNHASGSESIRYLTNAARLIVREQGVWPLLARVLKRLRRRAHRPVL